MILNSIEKAAKSVIFNPFTLIPFFIISMLSVFVGNYINIVLEEFLLDFFFFGTEIVNSNFGFILLTQYPIEILTILIAGVIMVALSIVAFASLSRYASGTSLVEAVNESVLDFKNALITSINLYIISFIAVALIFLITIIGSFTIIFGELFASFINLYIVPLVILVLIIFLSVKLIFIFATITEEKGKNVFVKSVEFSNDKTLSIIGLIILVGIIYLIISGIFVYISSILIDFELIISIISETITNTFLALSIAYYYFLQ
jgi:hypothetical protein